jgi:hypothetical protein
MRRVLVTLFALLCLPALGQAPGFIHVTGSKILDLTGNPASNAQICFSAVNVNGSPMGVRLGTGGQAIVRNVCAAVVNGAFSVNLPDTSQTMPANVCLAATITDNNTGASLLGGGYGCLQPSSVFTAQVAGIATPTPAATWCTSSGCNFDLYPPNQPALAVVQTGPAGAAGAAGQQGAQGAAGVPGVITAAGVNGSFMVPGTLTSQGGLAVSSSNCQYVGNYNAPTCSAIVTNFTDATHGTDALNLSLTQVGHGWNFGNYGSPYNLWSDNHQFTQQLTSSMRGITDGSFGLFEKRAAGDFFRAYDYITFSGGGAVTASDEAHGDRAINFHEYPDYFHGTMNVAGTGLTAISPTYVGGSNFTVDESLFIDTAHPIHTAFLVGPVAGSPNAATLVPGVEGLVYQRPVTAGTMPASTTVETCAPNTAGAYVVPAYDASHGATSTTLSITCTVLANASGNYVGLPTAGGVVTAQGNSWVEQVNYTATALTGSHTQVITASFRYPAVTLNLWYGGLQGYAFSIDNDVENTAKDGNAMRQLDFVLGSVDGVNMAYASEAYGNTAGKAAIPDPFVAGTPATGAITLFPYAEVVQNTTINGANPILEPNIIPFQVGDSVEDPFFGPMNWKVEAQAISISTPCNPSGECEARYVSIQGAGMTRGVSIDKVVNGTPNTFYTVGGGNSIAPDYSYVSGTFTNFAKFDTAPSTFLFAQNFNGTNAICVMCFGSSSNALQFLPATGVFNVTQEMDVQTLGAKYLNAATANFADTSLDNDTQIKVGATPSLVIRDYQGSTYLQTNSNGMTFTNPGTINPNASITSSGVNSVGYATNGAAGISGNLTLSGTCSVTVTGGLITGKTGC